MTTPISVGEILTAGKGRRYSPGGIIRRVMEVIGAGVLFPSLGGNLELLVPDWRITSHVT